MTIDWLAADWPAPDGVVAGCTTRGGGVSDGPFASFNLAAHVGDSAEQVLENRRRFVSICNLPEEPRWLEQVHGTSVAVEPESGSSPAADAVLTRKADTVCAVLTADCLPVLFVSSSGEEIGAAHAGWRGLCSGVLENTVHEFQTPAGSMLAWLGPAISQKHFEVGDEVRQAFVDQDERAADHFVVNDNGRWQANLYGLARLRLGEAGVRDIYGGDACTFDNQRQFFSYRRDGQCGRMASFVFRYG